jgi:peptidoglycan hydrolase-like protein with peptidoglycan-binding domain
MAVSFYRGKPDLYPEDVITKIQHAVKSPETGVADEDMVQGVAQFQQVNVLKVDGMAGPRTLPRLFNSGLATEADRKEFVAVGKDVEQNWATLGTAEERAKALFAGVKVQLDKEKVPTPTMEVGDTGIAAGVFTGAEWKITFGRAPLSTATISDDDARDLSGTVYHEARHAEQQHKMARMLATKGNTAAQIHAKMGIPDEIARDAVGNPLPRGIEFTVAAQQFDSEFGAGQAHHIQAEKDAPSAADLRAAQQAVKDNPTAANKQRLARLTAAFKAYHDLPTENDAFATEGDLEANWDEITANP